MHDVHVLRRQTAAIQQGLHAKGDATDLAVVLEHDRRGRELLQEIEQLRAQRNTLSERIAMLGRDHADAVAARERSALLGARIGELEQQHRHLTRELCSMLVAIPNVPDASVPPGKGHRVVRVGREPVELPFRGKAHWELAERWGLVDMACGAKVAGSSFAVLRGLGARLERALVQLMLDVHVREHGAREVSVPFLANRSSMEGTGQLPKMERDMYRLERDDLFLIPTAEVPITNLLREEVLEVDDLPMQLVGASPCFRREAGAAGRETRGLVRVHQFQKVELVHFVEPFGLSGFSGAGSEPSHGNGSSDHGMAWHPLAEITAQAEEVLRRLELPYRVVEVCAGDLSFASAKTYDLEVYAPGSGRWLEVSSASWFGDFQARRANIRYRNVRGKVKYVHTLNASGLAIPRTLIGILENYQQADGGVVLPPALKPYMGGIEAIDASTALR